MRWLLAAVFAASAFVGGATPASAAAPVNVVFGTTWDAPSDKLQNVVDAYIGVPGAITVTTDYIGAKFGELDPWFWVDRSVTALMITEIAGNAHNNTLGWYKETGIKPVIDGVDDGLIFAGLDGTGVSTIVTFPSGLTKFGFYMNPNGPNAALNAPEPELFFTNRFYNDIGPSGGVALHTPTDGDVQALVFDVSQWKGTNTWLVCLEDVDSGANVTPCCSGTDNDFNDMVFQVTALGATPNRAITFGQLKAKYNH
ncbi:MAG: hypothetical protein ABIU54_10230 [Candidatus Eisenbacteria bacterium]